MRCGDLLKNTIINESRPASGLNKTEQNITSNQKHPSHTLSNHYPIRIITILISIISDESELYLTESHCADSLFETNFHVQHKSQHF